MIDRHLIETLKNISVSNSNSQDLNKSKETTEVQTELHRSYLNKRKIKVRNGIEIGYKKYFKDLL